jgi:hypothetical protein
LITSSLQSIEASKKIYRFKALNQRALIKFVTFIDQFSRKSTNRIALTDKFVMIASVAQGHAPRDIEHSCPPCFNPNSSSTVSTFLTVRFVAVIFFFLCVYIIVYLSLQVKNVHMTGLQMRVFIFLIQRGQEH